MKGPCLIDAGARAVLDFSGPDAVRYLNGQVTQDVRLVVQKGVCLPACVTDAKGRIQFRVWVSLVGLDVIRVDAPEACAEVLEQRLTRYLIADDVEVVNRTGELCLWHAMGGDAGQGIPSTRWIDPGVDFWIPTGHAPGLAEAMPLLQGEALETFRISRKIPEPGRELVDGLFPAELGLEASDVSFSKGCYIGQEVISRIKSAGKVNKKLTLLAVDGSFPRGDWELLTEDGAVAGEVTSVSPITEGGLRRFLSLLKRGREAAWIASVDQKTPVVPAF